MTKAEAWNEFAKCAKSEQLEGICEQVSKMPTLSNMEMRLKKQQEDLERRLLTIRTEYVRREDLGEEMLKLNVQIEATYLSQLEAKNQWRGMFEQLQAFEKSNKKTVATLKDNSDYLEVVRKKLAEKAEDKTVKAIQEILKTQASYRDLKELYNKVLPPLSTFEKTM